MASLAGWAVALMGLLAAAALSPAPSNDAVVHLSASSAAISTEQLSKEAPADTDQKELVTRRRRCEVTAPCLPTPPPTLKPTQSVAPTKAPTNSPAPTKSPTKTPTPPTLAPTQQ